MTHSHAYPLAGRRTISTSIRDILRLVRRDGGVTVDECIHQLGHESIALGLMLFTLLSSLPLFGIPGFTTLTGVPIIFLGAQLVLAKEYIWLPERIRNKRLQSPKLWRALQRSLPKLRTLEKYLHPRWKKLAYSPSRNLIGGVYMGMGTLLALPIPLINFPAGFSMFVLSVGLVARDGVVIVVGLLMNLLLFCALLLTVLGAVHFGL